jgi:CubicO group peptidase (beta-lactamase class C family)
MPDDHALEAAFAAANLPGAVALLVDPEGETYARAFGAADAATGRAMEVDTLCQIASMTKALTSAAAMQLVEAGRLALDAPLGALPGLSEPRVLTGFDAQGQPQTRAPARPLTLRHLLTHTAGLGYAFTRAEVLRCYQAAGEPAPGTLATLDVPLLFDPGEGWEYGLSTDWVGLAIEAATGSRLGDYMAEHLFAPLGMTASAFRPALPGDAARVHARLPGGGFAALPTYIGGGAFDGGGGGLTATARDYGRFVRMILRGGELDGARVLCAASVAEMAREQVAPLRAGAMPSLLAELSNPFDPFPDQHTGWGLGFLINPEAGPHGRSPGSLAWAGIFNSYYWIDPVAGVGGVFMAQLSPFADAGALAMFGELERMAYA